MTTDTTTDAIASFLNEIGIPCRAGTLPESTLLPGIYLEKGEIVFDPARPIHPGDLLHEAGHVATGAPSARAEMTGNLDSGGGDEMAAIAWSYAACIHLGLEPEILFHAEGYKGESESLLECFASSECPVGVPLLAWYRMTKTALDGEVPAEEIYPRMGAWLREVEDPGK